MIDDADGRFSFAVQPGNVCDVLHITAGSDHASATRLMQGMGA